MLALGSLLKDVLIRGKPCFCSDEYLEEPAHRHLRFHPYQHEITAGWVSFARRKPSEALQQAQYDEIERLAALFDKHRSLDSSDNRQAGHSGDHVPSLALYSASDLCSAHLRKEIALLLQQQESPFCITHNHKENDLGVSSTPTTLTSRVMNYAAAPGRLAAQIGNTMSEFFALFSCEVVNGTVPGDMEQTHQLCRSATAELLEAAAAKLFWEHELPLPAGSFKRVSGVWVNSNVLRYIDWDSDSDMVDSNVLRHIDWDSDSDIDSDGDSLALPGARQQLPPRAVVGLLTSISDDGLFYNCTIEPGLTEEVEESEVQQGLVYRLHAAAITSGLPSSSSMAMQGGLVLARGMLATLTKEGADALGQPLDSLWRCAGVWAGREAVYVELHAAADARLAPMRIQAILQPGEVVQVGQDTLVATAEQLQHIKPSVQVQRMLPSWISNQLLPLPPEDILPPIGGVARVPENTKQFWASIFVAHAFFGRMRWKTGDLHVIKFVSMPEPAVRELFSGLPLRTAGECLELVIRPAEYATATVNIFAIGGWAGFPRLSAGLGSADVLEVQRAGIKVKWSPQKGRRLPRLRVEYYFSKLLSGQDPQFPPVTERF